MNQKILALIVASVLLAGCGTKTNPTAKITPTVVPKVVEMPIEKRPNISLIPRQDGHMLYLKIDKIPSDINQIEYEVLYNAVDNGQEIEKGVGDTIKEISTTLSRDLLLGTESCTNGCKYKYDSGIIGGTITVTFIDKNGQTSTFESPFTFKTTAEIKKDGTLKLTVENYSITPKTKLSGNDYFILMKSYRGGYSVFSSSNNSLVGDYQ